MRLLASLLIAVLLATGCSRRDRANPFDPGNPDTQGRPAGFVALAGNSSVLLRWEPLVSPTLRGYRIERRVEGTAEYQLLYLLLDPEASRFGDYELENGRRYDYRIYYVFDARVAPNAATDFATPGALRPWVTDLLLTALVRLTPDGRHVLSSDPLFESPTAVAVDPVQGVVWVSDSFSGHVVRFNPNDGDRLIINNLDRPGAIAVDPSRHTAWVCDERRSEVAQFRANGVPGSPATIGPVQLPLSVAVDPLDAAVWVCDNDARRLLLFAASGVLRWSTALPRPSRVAVDSVTDEGWVTSFESAAVMRVSAAGAVLDTIHGFQGPIGVAVDARRGRIWVADALAGAIVLLHRDGSQERRITGFRAVREIAVDPATGNAWATVPGDGRVVVLSPAGSLVTELRGLAQPFAIALDPGLSFIGGPSPTHGSKATLRAVPRPPSTSRIQ